MKNGTVIATMLAVAAGAASASFDAQYNNYNGVGGAFTISFTTTGGLDITNTYGAGHMSYTYTDMGGDRGAGQFEGGSFSSFCIELQDTRSGSHTYEIVNLNQAPNPAPGNGGPGYDSADAAEVNAIVAAAISLGWINNDLSAGANATNERMAAIQGHIWMAVLDEATVTVAKASLNDEMADLQAAIDSNPSGRVAGLRAMVNGDTQDQLFVVPLPTAAFAGLITLGGLAGVKRLRRA